MFSFFKRRAFLTFLGFLLLAIFIWFAGPLFSFADYAPLESVMARVILFGAIVLIWAIGRLLKVLRAYRASDRLVAAVVRQAPAQDGRPSAEAQQLRERFETAVATLKQSRRSGHSLYDLPWYVIIGAPGSGKTTALLNSGLKFPLEQRVGKGALRGVGGTRNCDWWFTDEAVFLDTAGRYTTQDSDTESDSAGWAEFLTLLRKYRKRRPLNGVILTISAQDLITQGERGREAHVEAARNRLNEINKELNIQLPVYVMVTKCDLAAGFSEYFDDLSQEGRAQVWGVTFPYEQTLKGDAARSFPEEFDQLIARLNARVFGRVDEDRDVRRRARIFAFPQQIAALRDALGQFVGDVFSSTRLDQQILLRGIYLTSGTQEGTPIDRLLGSIGRRYGVAPEAVVPPTGRGKAYFVERLLKEVMIGESGLAGVNRRLEVQKAAAQLGAYAAMAAVAALGVVALSVSYSRNRALVADTAAAVAKLKDTPPVAAVVAPEALLPRLDTLRSIVETADQYQGTTPWSMRWGLYQGDALGKSARDAYVRELDSTLLPRVAARIEERLVQFGPQPEKLYEYLKAYLMLGEPRFLKKDHLQFVAGLEWRADDNATPSATASLAKHFQSLLDYTDTLRPIATNASVLAQARSTVRQASVPRIIYGRLRRTYQEDTARAVRLDVAAGVGGEAVIRRKSGAKLSDPVPSFFSRDVFLEVSGKQVPEIVKSFAGDSWVWGDAAMNLSTSALAAEVINLYERDYIDTWDKIVADIDFVPFTDTQKAIDALGVISGPTSPLRGILETASENTQLLQAKEAAKPSATEAATQAIKDRINASGVAKELSGLFGTTVDPQARVPGALVTAHFQPIHRLFTGEPGNTPIDRLLLRIGQLQHQLKNSPDNALQNLQSPDLRDIVKSLQDESATLPPLVQGIVGGVGGRAESAAVSNAAGELERRYMNDVQRECTQILTGRYPFTPTSTTDLPLSDFARLFGYGGTFDKFFQENLEPLVDRSRETWTWRAGGAQGPRGILDQFARAQDIRELFFRRGSSALEVRFYLTVTEVDSSTIRFVIEIDGNGVEYRVPLRNTVAVWPGTTTGTAAVTWFERFGGQPRLSYLGPWAWFRLLGTAEEQRESDVRSTLTFQHSGHRSRVLMEATSVRNPFSNRDWQQFSCTF
jgi:type VI secretion system protein ImpL